MNMNMCLVMPTYTSHIPDENEMLYRAIRGVSHGVSSPARGSMAYSWLAAKTYSTPVELTPSVE